MCEQTAKQQLPLREYSHLTGAKHNIYSERQKCFLFVVHYIYQESSNNFLDIYINPVSARFFLPTPKPLCECFDLHTG